MSAIVEGAAPWEGLEIGRPPRNQRWVSDLVVLLGFAFTATALSLLLPVAAVPVAVLAAIVTGGVAGSIARDARAGFVFGSALAVFAALDLTFGHLLFDVACTVTGAFGCPP